VLKSAHVTSDPPNQIMSEKAIFRQLSSIPWFPSSRIADHASRASSMSVLAGSQELRFASRSQIRVSSWELRIRSKNKFVLWFSHRKHKVYMIFMWYCHRSGITGESKLDLLQGTLDVMVLQTLEAMGALHGYGVARRIEQVSGNEILLNQGTIYASLVRLQQRGWILARWGTSDNNRKAKFYSITKAGRKQLARGAAYWERLANVMGRVLAMESNGGKQ
jgi:transcriptional regulator